MKQELKGKIEHILYECNILRISYQTARDQILALIKEALPELAKEAGYKSPEEVQEDLNNLTFSLGEVVHEGISKHYVQPEDQSLPFISSAVTNENVGRNMQELGKNMREIERNIRVIRIQIIVLACMASFLLGLLVGKILFG